MKTQTVASLLIAIFLLSLQSALILVYLPFSTALEVLLKLAFLYIACWYIFKIQAIAMFVVNKKIIGQILILYIGIVAILVTTHDKGSGWGEIIYILFLLGLLISTVFFLAYQRLKAYM